MSIHALARDLLRVAIFQGLKPLQLTEIARRADRIVFAEGQTIIENGQEGDTAFFIASGRIVRLPDQADENAIAEILPEGSLVGEMAMLVDTKYTSTIIAHGEVRGLAINRTMLRSLMLNDTSIAEHFVDKIRERLVDLAAALREVDNVLGPISLSRDDIDIQSSSTRADLKQAATKLSTPTSQAMH